MIKTRVVKIDKDKPNPRDVKLAIKILHKGGLVAFPTETVYGLAVNSKDKKAVEKLSIVKNRAKDKPFTVLVKDTEDIDNLASDILPAAYRLMDKFWPGPLTIILKSIDSSTVGLRIPKCAFVLELIKGANFPIVCPSANLSGNREPLAAQDVLEDLEGKIDLVFDGGRIELGVPSTVVDVRSLPFKMLRRGFVKEELIEEVSSKKRVLFVCTGNSCRSVMAAALFKKKLKERGRNDIEVDSAGLISSFILGASFETQQLLKEEGVDVSGHRSKRVDENMLRSSDLILVMERFQEEKLLAKNPSLKNRLYLLKGFSQFKQDNLEIKDPMNRGLEVYKKSLADIDEAVSRLVDLV